MSRDDVCGIGVLCGKNLTVSVIHIHGWHVGFTLVFSCDVERTKHFFKCFIGFSVSMDLCSMGRSRERVSKVGVWPHSWRYV
jgi:hypothetical protein